MDLNCFMKIIIAVLLEISFSQSKRVKRIVGGQPAAVPPEDDPVAFVYLDDHDAKVYGTRDKPDGYYNFRGIRYAEPPVGRFRFQRPRKLRIRGEINATIPGPPCPQPDPLNGNEIIGSEDCLFLNVFTPSLPDGNEGLPVMMWIHGGGYRRGSASQYGVRHLVNKKLVVVTIQYRLGSLGFLSAGAKELPGNAGMFDMALALKWIKDYISFFGGNPNKITVCGQGTGASSAILLSLSEFTRGFLGGVLAMSGSALSAFAIDHNPLATGRELASHNGCPQTPVLEMVKCLQEVSVKTLVNADSGFQELRLAAQGVLAGIIGLLGPAPSIEGSNDGRFLPNFLQETPLDDLKAGRFPNIPLLTGVTRDETAPMLFGKYRKEILEKLKNSPNFVNQFLNGIIQNSGLIGSLFNRTDELIQNVASKYFQILQKDTSSILRNMVETTGDALFNLPGFQMAKLWSKNVGKTFFYSFDQKSKHKGHSGNEFLNGLPLVENDNTGFEGEIGHGDDLPFIFDPQSMYGNESNVLHFMDPEDLMIQNITTNFIAEFARTGAPKLLEGDQPPWPTFSEEKNDYVTITSKPKPRGNFRFCQMALWSGMITRLQSTTCETLWGITKFSEDALAVVDHAFQQGVGTGAVINTAIQGTIAENEALINSVLNKTMLSQPNIQTQNLSIVNTVIPDSSLGKSRENVGEFLSGLLNGSNKLTNENIELPSELNNTEKLNRDKEVTEIESNFNVENEMPVTESNTIELSNKQSTQTNVLNGSNIFQGLIIRPTIFPRPNLLPRPLIG